MTSYYWNYTKMIFLGDELNNSFVIYLINYTEQVPWINRRNTTPLIFPLPSNKSFIAMHYLTVKLYWIIRKVCGHDVSEIIEPLENAFLGNSLFENIKCLLQPYILTEKKNAKSVVSGNFDLDQKEFVLIE